MHWEKITGWLGIIYFNSFAKRAIINPIKPVIKWGVMMGIVGLQKMTLLDFPGKVACTVFLGGCNFRCPFCHNGGLLEDATDKMQMDEFLHFLKGRQKLLDGVCITGGEPTLFPELPTLMKQIKDLGFAVKLDTNGSEPEVLKTVVQQGLVDYVAMDVKNCPHRYAETVGLSQAPMDKIAESLCFLMEGHVDYELRTTVVHQFHDEATIEDMGKWLHELRGGKKIPKLFLQPFVQRASVLDRDLTPPETAKITDFAKLLSDFVQEVSVRG